MAKSHMMPSVCFDTTPLIWGVREDAEDEDFHMIHHTKNYIKSLSDSGHAIMVPSPVVAEYLVGATDTQFHEARILRRGFRITDLDARCAELAAKLQRGGIVDAIHDEYGIPKQNIRIDAFIIAIAIENGALKIITNNTEEFKKLSRGKIPIEGVPILHEQQTMEFEEMPGNDAD